MYIQDSKSYLKPSQVAKRLGVHRLTVYRWIAASKPDFPKPVKHDDHFYFDLSELEAWETNHKQ